MLADGSDLTWAAALESPVELAMENPPSVDAGQPVAARVRAGDTNTSSSRFSLLVEVREGSQVRASATVVALGPPAWLSFSLTPAERASVVNWSDVSVRLTPSWSAGSVDLGAEGRVYEVELEYTAVSSRPSSLAVLGAGG